MPRFDIALLGVPALEAQLAALPVKVERRVIAKALRSAANLILPVARARAPRKSGVLQRTIRTRALRRSRNRIGFGVFTGRRADLGIPADARYYYPAAQEIGWTPSRKRRNTGGLRRSGLPGRQRRLIRVITTSNNGGGRIPGQHFMQRAFLDREQSALGILQREISQGIEAEASRR